MRRAVLLVFALAWVAGAARAAETRCWLDEGAVVVAASFGDIAGDFILDLAAPASRLHVTRAASDGIVTATARRDLVLAGERLARFPMTVADLDARTAPFATSIAGVIGADALSRFTVEIDFSPCQVVLTRHGGKPGRGAPTLREIAGVPAVRASYSDGIASRAGWFALATGEAASRIARARLSRTLPAAGPAPPTRLRALAIGGSLFEQTPAALAAATPPGLDGSIGTAVLSRFAMRVDIRAGWMALSRQSEASGAKPPSSRRERAPSHFPQRGQRKKT